MSKAVRAYGRFLGLAMCLGFLSACNTQQDAGLFSDAKQDVCPPGCTDTLVSDDSQIAVKVMNSTITLASTDTRVDIGGECYASLYPSNRIFVSVTDSSNTAYTVTYYGINSSGTTAYCVNGRFDVAVSLGGLPAHGVFNVQVNLVAYDDSGTHTNNSDGISYVTVRR